MAFQQLLRVRSVKHVEQKASDGGLATVAFLIVLIVEGVDAG